MSERPNVLLAMVRDARLGGYTPEEAFLRLAVLLLDGSVRETAAWCARYDMLFGPVTWEHCEAAAESYWSRAGHEDAVTRIWEKHEETMRCEGNEYRQRIMSLLAPDWLERAEQGREG